MPNILTTSFGLCTVSGVAGAADLCVSNATGERLHFTQETSLSGERAAADLFPGQSLCLPGAEGGTVAAFETAASVEGCPRLVAKGGQDRPRAFARFERRTWALHYQGAEGYE